MKQLFVFTAINNVAVQHLKDSIINPIKSDIIDQYLDQNEINKYNNTGTGIFAWGAVPGDKPSKPNIAKWGKMNVGDYVLTVCKKNNYQYYRFISEILDKRHDAQFAESIWKRDNKGQTWEYMYFLTPPKEIDFKVSTLNEILSNRYQGFASFSDKTNSKIIDKYGSIENFANEQFSYSPNGIAISKELSEKAVIETEKEVTIRKNAAITGKEAEDEFENWANNQGWKVINTSDLHGLGYDFECVTDEGEKLFVEVKGCRGGIDSVRLTELEWKIAEEKGDSYLLVVISNLDDEDIIINQFDNPYARFKNNIGDPYITLSVSYHLNKQCLIDALED